MLSEPEQIKDCADRYYCISGSSVAKPIDNVRGRLCAAGYYCRNGLQIPCPPGTYEPRRGALECQLCPAGYFCAQGSTQPQLCPERGFCPPGSEAMEVCPPGSYNANTGLEEQAQCVPCPTGFYCQDGRLLGECDAGYFCYTGSASAQPADPDDDERNYSNGPCPLGHFCLQGAQSPTVCSAGRIRATVGAREDADCEVCPAGFYCINGSPVGIPCPKGMYCPSSSPAQPVECPLNTYNELLQQDEEADCLSCTVFATHFCNSRRITSQAAYRCPVGHFCVRSQVLTSPQLCEPGSYAPNRGHSNRCRDCPAGSACAEGQVIPSLCLPASVCPPKAHLPLPCPPGRFCSQGDSAGTECPAAFFCPEATHIPTKCPDGTFCPPGSPAPTRCPPGFVASFNPHNVDQRRGCVQCDKGSYTTEPVDGAPPPLRCLPCEPGYVCLRECNQQFPTVRSEHNGYACPPGHYCPAGSFQEIPCPPATYAPHYSAVSRDQCRPCPSGTYNFLHGQSACRPCGPTASAPTGATTCACLAAHRVFHQSAGTCSCQTGFFEPRRDVSDDTAFDCVPEARAPCPSHLVADEFSRCVPPLACELACGSTPGAHSPVFGLCLCEKVPALPCDRHCAATRTRLFIEDPAALRVQLANGTSWRHELFTDSVRGRMACPERGCEVLQIYFDGEGALAASYTPDLSSLGRSLLEGGGQLISSPAICLKAGDALLFQVEGGPAPNFPEYVRESVLNSDSQFDAEAFLALREKVLDGEEAVSRFLFQFSAPGLFLFASRVQPRRYLVVRVLAGQLCPDETHFIQPLTAESLLALGVPQFARKQLRPPWGQILSAFAFFLSAGALTFVLVARSHARYVARAKEALFEDEPQPQQRSLCFVLSGRSCRRGVAVAPKEEAAGLGVQDVRRIQEKAALLAEEVGTLFARKDSSYQELVAQSREAAARLGAVSALNKLEEAGAEQKTGEEGLELELGETGEGDELEAEAEREMAEVKGRAERLVEALKTDVQKRTAACELEVWQRQNRTVERAKQDLDLYLRSALCVFTEREQRHLRAELEGTLAQLRSLVKQELELVEQCLESKVLLEQQVAIRIVERAVLQELERKRQLARDYRAELQQERARLVHDLHRLRHGPLPPPAETGSDAGEWEEPVLDLEGVQGAAAVERALAAFDGAQQARAARREEAARLEEDPEYREEQRARRAAERRRAFAARKEELKEALEVRQEEVGREVLYYSEMLTNMYQDSRVEALNQLAEQERRVAAYELQRDYAREFQRLETQEFEQLAQLNGRLRLLGLPPPVEPQLVREVDRLEERRDRLATQLETLDEAEGESRVEEAWELAEGADSSRGSLRAWGTREELAEEAEEVERALAEAEKQVSIARGAQLEAWLERKALVQEKLNVRAESRARREAKLAQLGVDERQDRQDVIAAQLAEHLEIAEAELLDNEDLTYVSSKMVDCKQAAELAHVLTVLVNERAEFLKMGLLGLFADKLDELALVREEQGRGQAHAQGPAGGGADDRKKDLDLKYFELVRAHEQNTRLRYDARNAALLGALREGLFHAKNELLKKYVTKRERKLKAMEQERRARVAILVDDFKALLARALETRELAARQEQEQLAEYLRHTVVRPRQVDLAAIQRQRAAHRAWLAQRKALHDEKQRQLAQLLANPALAPPQRRALTRQFRRAAIRGERLLWQERTRQQALLGERVKQRPPKQETRDQKLALYRLHQDKLTVKQLGEVLLGFGDDFESMLQRYDEHLRLFEKLAFPGRMRLRPPRGGGAGRQHSPGPKTPMSFFFQHSRFGKMPSTFSNALRWLDRDQPPQDQDLTEREVLVEVNARLDRLDDLLREGSVRRQSRRPSIVGNFEDALE